MTGIILAILLFTNHPAIVDADDLNYDHYLPHVANGAFEAGTFRTSFVLFNNGNENETVRLKLTNDDGQPLVVTIPGLGTGSEFTTDLESGVTKIFQTDGTGPLITGAAKVSSSFTGTGVSSIFSIYDNSGSFVTEAGVGDSPGLENFTIPVEVTADLNTGLALWNPWVVDVVADLILRDTAGKEAARTTIIIPPGKHLARFVAGPGQFFTSITEFRGTLTASLSAYLPVVALRQNSIPLSYTSLPAVNSMNQGTSLFLPHVATGAFDQGRFRSSFMLLNPDSSGANVRLSLSKSDGTPLEVTLEGRGKGSGFDFQLEPYGSAFVQTDGTGPLTVGTATVSSDKLIGAAGIFSVFDAEGRFKTEAGVGAAGPPLSPGLTLPVDITGNFDTGVAFFNPGDAPAEFTLKLLKADGEQEQANRRLSLGPRQHIARFVSELFPGTTDFRGSLAAYTSGVVALTLRQNSVPLSYTTLPINEGVSEGKLPPLVPQTQTGVSANADSIVNATLSSGFNITGNVAGDVLSISARSSTDEVFTARQSYRGPTYSLVVPQGTYALSVCYRSPMSLMDIRFTDPTPLVVPNDRVRDVLLPSLSLTEVRGTVTGLPVGLPTSSVGDHKSSAGSVLMPLPTPRYIVFTNPDYSVAAQQQIEGEGTYTTALPAGNYRVSLYLPGVLNPDGSTAALTLFDVGRLSVGDVTIIGANFAVPPLVRLSVVSSGEGVGGVRATDRSAPPENLDPCGVIPSYSSTWNESARYQLTLLAGRSYNVQGLAPRYPAIPVVIPDVAEDTSLVLNPPPLPPIVTISGTVKDDQGRPVANAEVILRSQSITGAPGLDFSGGAITDENGEYDALVLAGTGYRLVITPRTPPAP